jgi:hypothetical protein
VTAFYPAVIAVKEELNRYGFTHIGTVAVSVLFLGLRLTGYLLLV